MDDAEKDPQAPVIAPLELSDAPELLDYIMRNRLFLQGLEPLRPDEYFTLEGQVEDIRRVQSRSRDGDGFAFGLFSNGALVGRVALSNVVRGAGQYATIGYSVDQRHNGKGHATEAVRLAVAFAFRDAGLHRVQGAVMPGNLASARVLAKAGFRSEGHFLRYLRIAGCWADHDIYAITEEDWTAGGTPRGAGEHP
ncbi:MAG: GNAT family N-acetyltransferase [Actinobacteria bacterium]|nr:GNAT family N-acetyltransferase [Actinomycetota bacterium]